MDIPNGTLQASFRHQYSQIYWLRLVALRKRTWDRAQENWEEREAVHQPRVLDVAAEQLNIIVGNVYVEMPRKANVLDELAKDHYLHEDQHINAEDALYSESDSVFLEDESGRIQLVGAKIVPGEWVTGTMRAVLGYGQPNGSLEALEWIGPGCPKEAPNLSEKKHALASNTNGSATRAHKKVALVSGLDLGNVHTPEQTLRLSLLREYLLGQLDDSAEAITHLVLAGNTMAIRSESSFDEKENTNSSPLTVTRALLAELFEGLLEVAIIPGPHDPVAPLLPQQPLHRGLLSGLGVKRLANPDWLHLEGLSLLVSAGQPLADLQRYLKDARPLDAARFLIESSHMAPTCPDTLWTYALADYDPFVIESRPHVMVHGNQPEFETDIEDNVRVVCLPSFSETGVFAVLDRDSLDVTPIALL